MDAQGVDARVENIDYIKGLPQAQKKKIFMGYIGSPQQLLEMRSTIN